MPSALQFPESVSQGHLAKTPAFSLNIRGFEALKLLCGVIIVLI